MYIYKYIYILILYQLHPLPPKPLKPASGRHVSQGLSLVPGQLTDPAPDHGDQLKCGYPYYIYVKL